MRGKRQAALSALCGALCFGSVTAFGFTGESETTPPVLEETTETASPFSVPGNGNILDDIAGDDTKRFVTVRTKNGNTFFLVLDGAGSSDNVYMLSMIDEADLAEFLEEEPEKEKKTGLLFGRDAEPEAETETEKEPETESAEDAKETEKPGKRGAGAGMYAAGLLALVGIAGGYYRFKVVRPRREEEKAKDEGIEFYDESPYEDEDGEKEE